MGKVELYTCESGLTLFGRGFKFGAWEKGTESYNDSKKNIKILVAKGDFISENNVKGEYRIININSVEVVGND